MNHYFQAHTIAIITEHPLKSVLDKADLSGCIAKWSLKLEQYDLKFISRTEIKVQALADFVAKFTYEIPKE